MNTQSSGPETSGIDVNSLKILNQKKNVPESIRWWWSFEGRNQAWSMHVLLSQALETRVIEGKKDRSGIWKVERENMTDFQFLYVPADSRESLIPSN